MVVECDKCQYTAQYNSLIRRHQNRVHNDQRPWKCTFPHCKRRSKSKTDLKKHQKVHEANPEVKRPYPCSIDGCDYRASEKWSIAGHIRSKHTPGKTRDFHCPLCPCKFYTFSNLKAHVSRHTKEIKFACYQCDYKTHEKASLKSHVKKIHAEAIRVPAKKFLCSFPGCNSSCVNQTVLRNHERRIHGTDLTISRPLPCSYPSCTFRAFSTPELNGHLHVRHNPNRKRDFPCSLCPKEFYDRNGLRSHISNVHINESKYSCEECNFTTKSRFRLRHHVRVVHKEGPGRERKLKCDSCDYRACDSQRLRRHQNTVHNKDRKYSCEQLGCTFRTNFLYFFKQHSTIHEDDPNKKFPFPCSFPSCDFRRRVRYEMTAHEKRHESCDSQLECTLCDAAARRFYPDKVSLEFHNFLCHNNGVSYNCQLCHFVGMSKKSLAGHMHILHGTDKDPGRSYTAPLQEKESVVSRRPGHTLPYAVPVVVLHKVVLKVV